MQTLDVALEFARKRPVMPDNRDKGHGQPSRHFERQNPGGGDLEANVLLLEGMLRVAGYRSVESTTDPAAVCELHRKNRYSLILLDLQMPGMDGFQVMEGLKEIEEAAIFRYS